MAKAKSIYNSVDEQKFLTKKEYVGFALNSVGNSFRNTFGSFASLITARFLGFDATTYATLVTITLVLSIWDIINDVLVANIIDKERIKSKHGKFKAIIFVCMLPTTFVPLLQWLPLNVMNPELSQGFKMGYVIMIYLLNDLFTTFNNAATNGLLSRITPSNRERSIVSAIQSIISSPLGSSAMVVMMVIPFMMPGASEPTQYFVGTTLLTVIGTPLAYYLYFIAKERIVVDEVRVKPPKFREVYKDVIHNRPMMAIIVSEMFAVGFTLTGFAYTFICRDILSGIEFNFFGYKYVTDTSSVMLFVSIICGIPTVISIILAPIIRRYVDDRKLFMATRGLSAVCYIVMFFLTYPAGNYEPKALFWRIVIPYAIHGFTTGFYNIIPTLMTYDALDYGEWKTGRRTEATVYALKNMISRIGGSLITWIGGLMLVAIDYPTDSVTALLEPHTKEWLLVMFTILPGVCCVFSCIAIGFYNYVGDYKNKIVEELQIRRDRIEAEKALSESDEFSDDEGELSQTDSETAEVLDGETELSQADNTVFEQIEQLSADSEAGTDEQIASYDDKVVAADEDSESQDEDCNTETETVSQDEDNNPYDEDDGTDED